MKVKLIKNPNTVKKFRVILEDGRKVDFGLRGYSDYTKHQNPLRMRSYVSRHAGKIPASVMKETDPKKVHRSMLRVANSNRESWGIKGVDTAGFWSRWLLWSAPTLSGAKKVISDKFNIVFT